ncbi:hypothetical protein BDN72DRAFT_905961 [Pluteus cervinus]|uniref:Uncharacterized protein n=1 Tax=Pluteus cervinus TaxID=181527 RepID=A0ACD3A100_9AGAR|nr:hypothetical protein BDN72DRAFT_905961 [Pluteus cervinus]
MADRRDMDLAHRRGFGYVLELVTGVLHRDAGLETHPSTATSIVAQHSETSFTGAITSTTVVQYRIGGITTRVHRYVQVFIREWGAVGGRVIIWSESETTTNEKITPEGLVDDLDLTTTTTTGNPAQEAHPRPSSKDDDALSHPPPSRQPECRPNDVLVLDFILTLLRLSNDGFDFDSECLNTTSELGAVRITLTLGHQPPEPPRPSLTESIGYKTKNAGWRASIGYGRLISWSTKCLNQLTATLQSTHQPAQRTTRKPKQQHLRRHAGLVECYQCHPTACKQLLGRPGRPPPLKNQGYSG